MFCILWEAGGHLRLRYRLISLYLSQVIIIIFRMHQLGLSKVSVASTNISPPHLCMCLAWLPVRLCTWWIRLETHCISPRRCHWTHRPHYRKLRSAAKATKCGFAWSCVYFSSTLHVVPIKYLHFHVILRKAKACGSFGLDSKKENCTAWQNCIFVSLLDWERH